ncbi:MAG: DUF1932 domain-containing protein [Chloroflexi bacterium]|nr:DUF1932 domain-containing protein [Chloroflexota bacterium]
MADSSGAIGLLHPGAMGASVGAALVGRGHRVLWASEGRSASTRERAESAGLKDAGSIDRLTELCGTLISVCPPDAALALAGQVAGTGFAGVYVDANAVSPARGRAIEEAVLAGGARTFVDGGIIGPPAWKPGITRLYLSGAEAEDVAGLFEGSPLEAIAIGPEAGAASALKMAYAAYTKGTSALLAGILALAEREGVAEALRTEWTTSQAELASSGEGRALGSAAKAWRFAGEMEEIADTFAGAGLPDGFHRAAAEIFRRWSEFKDVPEPPAMDEALAALLAERAGVAR